MGEAALQRIEISGGLTPHFFGSWELSTPSLCDRIIDFFESHPALQRMGRSSTGLNQAVKKTTDINVKPADLAIPQYSVIAEYMHELNECFADYLVQWPFLETVLPHADIGDFNIQKYDAGGHFAAVHSERTTLASAHRVLVWMTYLNDVAHGGETNFKHFGLSVQPKRAKTLIWPAEWTHAHAGNEVISGTKYIITGWMHFPLP